MRNRTWRGALTALVVLLAVSLVDPGTADAQTAPRRADSYDRAVYLIHGYGSDGHICASYWDPAIAAMKSWGFKNTTFYKVRLYKDDEGCSTDIDGNPNGDWDRGEGLDSIGKALANHIYKNHSSKGQAVDILAVSMGGLIARSAIDGTAKNPGRNGYPRFIYVEDVVTLATPHLGTTQADAPQCAIVTQCIQMRPNSTFLNGLGHNPQSAMGTDWTIMGSRTDDWVPHDSAIGMRGAAHKVVYAKLDHGQFNETWDGTFKQDSWNSGDTKWTSWPKGASPIRAGATALYRHKKW